MDEQEARVIVRNATEAIKALKVERDEANEYLKLSRRALDEVKVERDELRDSVENCLLAVGWDGNLESLNSVGQHPSEFVSDRLKVSESRVAELEGELAASLDAQTIRNRNKDCLVFVRQRDEWKAHAKSAESLLSQWHETYHDGFNPDGDLIDETADALDYSDKARAAMEGEK